MQLFREVAEAGAGLASSDPGPLCNGLKKHCATFSIDQGSLRVKSRGSVFVIFLIKGPCLSKEGLCGTFRGVIPVPTASITGV